MNTTKNNLCKLVYAAVCLALCLVLPFLTGQHAQVAVGERIAPDL